MTKREIILEAAEELFAENGYDATSVRALALKANVNIAMISYYFGSKEKLFEALVEYRASYLREKIQDLAKDDAEPMERIERLIDLYVNRIFSQHRFHRILYRQISLQNRSDLNSNIVGILMKNLEAVRSIINDGIEKKVFRKVDSELFIGMLIGTISQVTLSSLLTATMLGDQCDTTTVYNNEIKNRLIHFLNDVCSSYLRCPHNKESN